MIKYIFFLSLKCVCKYIVKIFFKWWNIYYLNDKSKKAIQHFKYDNEKYILYLGICMWLVSNIIYI